MRNLIRKILFEEFHNPKIFLEEISLRELNSLITLTEGTASIHCDNKLYNIANRLIASYYDELDSFKYRKNRFTVNQTDHYCRRYKRKQELNYINNPNIYNPKVNEGIDLVFNGIPLIYDIIVNNDWEKRKELCFKLTTDSVTNNGDIVPFSIAIVVNKNLIKASKSYRIALKTQIKGVKLNDGDYNHCGDYII